MANETIYPYGQGGQVPSSVGLGHGTFADAYDLARTHNQVFEWLLTGEDYDGYSINKPIWHIGNRKFVDAIGVEINGVKNGVTINCNAACDVKIGTTTFQLTEGENNISFSEIGSDTTDVFNIYESGTTTTCYDKITGIDFGWLKFQLKDANASPFLRTQSEIKFIKRLYLDVAVSYYQIMLGLGKCKYLQIAGSSRRLYENFIGLNIYGNNGMPVEEFDFRGFNIRAKNIRIGEDTMSAKVIDIRDLDTKDTTTLKLPKSSVLEKLVIGNLTNENMSENFGLASTDAVLICTAATPPKLKNCTFADDVAQDEHSSTTDWVEGHFSAIYVPSESVELYKTDTYVENGTIGNTGWSKYASIIHDISEYNG